jgi:hypothetical protein
VQAREQCPRLIFRLLFTMGISRTPHSIRTLRAIPKRIRHGVQLIPPSSPTGPSGAVAHGGPDLQAAAHAESILPPSQGSQTVNGPAYQTSDQGKSRDVLSPRELVVEVAWVFALARYYGGYLGEEWGRKSLLTEGHVVWYI